MSLVVKIKNLLKHNTKQNSCGIWENKKFYKKKA